MSADELLVRDTWRGVGGDAATIDDVLARHREPHRHYHTVRHVAAVLRTVDELCRVAEPVAHRALTDTLHVAAIFHDVVYDVRAGDNERRSARLATAACTRLHWEPEAIDEVQRLILATAAHAIDDDGAVAIFCDADLAVLGAQPEAYAAYVTGVRSEYAHVDEDAWQVGRSAVLRSFLEREHIFATSVMRDRSERRARANLAAELAGLRRPS